MAIRRGALAAILTVFLVLPAFAQSGYDTAVTHYVRGNYNAAIVFLSQYVEDTPDPDAYYLLGYAFYNLGKHEEANEYFKAAFLIDPEYSPQPLIRRLEKAKAAEGITKPLKKPVIKKPVIKKQPLVIKNKSKEPIPVKEPVAPAPAAPATPVTNEVTAAVPVTNAAPVDIVVKKPSIPVKKPAASFYKSLLADYGLALVGAIGALYIISSFCLFLSARKLGLPATGLSASWVAFIPVLQVLPYVKVMLMLLKKGKGIRRLMGVLLIVPGVNVFVLVMLAFTKKENATSTLPELGDYPEPDLPEPPGFASESFTFEKEAGAPDAPDVSDEEGPMASPTPAEEESAAPWAEWDEKSAAPLTRESVTPAGEGEYAPDEGEGSAANKRGPSDEFLRRESERVFEDIRGAAAIKTKLNMRVLLIILAVLLVLVAALAFAFRGVLFSAQTAPPAASAAAMGVSWDDPAGDAINDISGSPRPDIVWVKAEGRDGVLVLSARINGVIDAGHGAPIHGASIVEYYLDADNNAETGGTGLFRGEANRPIKGYEFRIAVASGFYVRDGASIEEISGDLEIDTTKNPILGNVVSYKIWTMQNGELASLNSAVWSYEALTKSVGDSVEVRVPYELLGLKPGGAVRLCFNEVGQKSGEGFSEDKTVNLGGGAPAERPSVKKPWDDFLGASEKGDVLAIKAIAEGATGHGANKTNKALYDIALYRAALNGHPEVVRFLLEKGANPNIRDDAGQSPIFLAAVNRRADVAKDLIKNGADVNAKTVAGETALIRAVAWGDAEIVKLLLKAGAKANVKSESGHSPLKLAQDAKRPDLVKLLKGS